MDRFFRLILLVSLFACHLAASAAGVWVKVSNPMWGSTSSPYPSALAYCNAWRANFSGLYTEPTITYESLNSEGARLATCKFRYTDTNNYAAQITVGEFCPSGAWVDGAGCYQQQVSCPSGSVAVNGVCGAPNCTGGQHYDSSTGSCVSTCNAGDKYGPSFTDIAARCVQTPKGPCMAMPTVVSSPKGTSYRYIGTGDLCSGSDSPSPEEKGDDKKSEACSDLTCPPKTDGSCASGYSGGTVNGASLCVRNTTDTKTTTESSSDGSSSSTQKQTSCQGDTCTTTTTTSKDDGTGSTKTTTSTTTQSKDGYCTENPDSPACKDDETSWGGDCETQFVCDGDAVQCAQAQAGWQAACSLKADKNSSVIKAGQKAVDGGDKSDIEQQLGKDQSTTFNLASMLDSTPLFGGSGGCPGDASVSVGGVGVSIPFSMICPLLNQIGIAMQAFAYLVAAFVVFRRGN